MKRIIAIATILVFLLVYAIFSQVTELSVIEYDGYAVDNNNIAQNLISENITIREARVKSIKFSAYDNIYKQYNNIYIGKDERTKIDETFPLYVNNNLTIINLSNKSTLIDEQFVKYDGYPDSLLSEGILYNRGDNERADYNNYYFLVMPSGMHINSKVLTIKTSLREIKISLNSIINFEEDKIKYYSLEDDTFIYYKIDDVDDNSIITIEGKDYKYIDFLKKLGVYEEELPDTYNPNDLIEDDKPNDNNEGTGTIEVVYQKPSVDCDDFQGNVYSATTNLRIIDPSSRINKSVTFELKKDGNLFLRKAFISSGKISINGLEPNTTYEVKGYYTYRNEDKVLIENTFYTGTITTKSMESLPNYNLSFQNGTIFSDRIEIANLKIVNGLDTELVKGTKRIAVKIGDDEYNLSNQQLNHLLNGKEVLFETPETLKSNQKVNYEIVFYDIFGNQLKADNSKGTTKTSKQIPTASVKVVSNTVNKIELGIELNNPDQVNISNYRYIIQDTSGVIVKQGSINDNTLSFNDLDLEQIYLIYVYGNYDINDGNGSIKDQLLAESKFATDSISKLGYVRIKMETDDVSQNSVRLKMQMNDITDARLVSLLEKMHITLNDGTTVTHYALTDEQVNSLKNREEVLFDISNLSSATEYALSLTSIVKQGTKSYSVKTLASITSVKTLKQNAQVLIKNKFTTENLIDFDVKIEDINEAIDADRVILEIRNNKNKVIDSKYLNINDEYMRITLDKLEKEQNYTFTYIAESYNLGYKEQTLQVNVVLAKETITTTAGISGNIGLTSLLKEQQGKNLFDINNLQKWRGYGGGTGSKTYSFSNRSLSLKGTNGWYNYSYFLPEYKSQTLTISFYAKYISDENNNKAKVYVANGYSSNTSYSLQNLSEEYQKYTYTFKMNTLGYVGFLIYETSGRGLSTMVSIKDLQIEEGSYATPYEEFKTTTTYNATTAVALNDLRDEIVTNDYYVKIHKGNSLVDSNKYDMEENFINHTHKYVLDENSNYTLDLIVKIREREYTISTTSFTTEAEIRSIKTTTDFFNMHSNGKYIVLNDLDFTRINSYYGTFSGELDFQGHTIYLNRQNRPNYLINTLNTTAIVKNLNVEIDLDNTVEISGFYGFVYYNGGNIENIMINLNHANELPNTNISLMVGENRGIIDGFVINSQAKLSGIREITYGAYRNYGTIKNGYIYGEPINVTYSNPTTGSKRVGAIAAYTSESSIIENVYSLIQIDSTLETTYDKQVGNLVGESARGILRNAYSVGTGIGRDLTRDPNVGTVSNLNYSNLFYASDDIYTSKYSIKVAKLAIKDTRFQTNVLNSENRFNIDEMIEKGYYPQLNFPNCMPNQDRILLPEVKDDDLVDITSLEILETNGDTAKVVFNVNNPDAERIARIDVKNVNTRILSQTYAKGKTQVIAEISNPSEYVSKYYVKKIVSVGVYNITTTRTYQDNERVLLFDLYRRVYNIDDFKLIKDSPKENYLLEADLDFAGISGYLLGTFAGKLDGNNHTLSNIRISSGNGLISTLNGTIKNLNINGYTQDSSTAYAGLVYSAASGSIIDNVHMKKVDVTASSRIGGLVGSGSGVTIKNSSVIDFKHTTKNQASEDLYIGAIAGYLDNSYIENSYADNLDIDVTKARTTYGVGGILGRMDSGVIKNVYAIGTIKTSSSHTGGIVGYTSGRISNVFSNVDIISSLDYIGGIAGRSDNVYITNTVVFGHIYSSYITTYMHRTAGNVLLNKSNYVWDKQMINGSFTEDLYGEYFVTKEDLLNETIYSNTIGLGESFDYTEISKGYLPKIKNTDGSVLPNQKNHTLKIDNVLNIDGIEIFKGTNTATIKIDIDNPNNLKIDNISFDYLSYNDIDVTKNENINGKTIFEVVVTPTRFYDSYKITGINYQENGVSKTIAKTKRIEMQFYKRIVSVTGDNGWQSISSDTAENYLLSNDLDFTGYVNIKTNVSIGRLEGTDNGHTIKNINLEVNGAHKALIGEITTSLKNVSFENITINNTINKEANFNNLIKISYAKIQNVNFKDITLTAPKMSYVGIIGNQRGYLISDIKLENINCTGSSYTGSLIAYSYNVGTRIQNIDAKDVTVSGYNYTGGIMGYRYYSGTTYIYDVSGDNMNVTGNTYVGGLFGMGGGANITVLNSTVHGSGSYIGGIGGHAYNYSNSNNIVRNSTITGDGNYTGGMYGYSYVVSDSYIFDSTVKSTKESSKYTGGIVGETGYSISKLGVINTDISTNGSYAGGIRGYQNAGVAYSYVYDSTIRAKNGAGGISGYVDSGTVQDSYVNAQITATEENAGGIYGYVQNSKTTNSIQISRIIRGNVFNSVITAYGNAGGLIGYAAADLYKDVENNIYHYYSNIVVATINTTYNYGNATVAVGNNNQYASSIKNLKVYDKTTINGVAVENILTSGINSSNLISSTNLKTQVTYTGINYSTSGWDFTNLVNNYFPLVRNGSSVNLLYQTLISIPEETQIMAVFSKVHELPTFDAYAVDVDKINIEFNKADENSTFTYKSGNVSSNPILIDKRAYTFEYNYQNPIEITISDGLNTKKATIKVTDVRRNISVYGDNYYYIKDDLLESNIRTLDNTFIHIFGNKGLDEYGNVYNLETREILKNISSINLLSELTPMYEFTYDNYQIKTFNKYSVVIGEEEIVNDLVLLVKNNNLSVFDGDLNTIHLNTIIDNYNENIYQAILGTNSEIYNLKEKFKVPAEFDNKNIKAVSNNLNSSSNIIIVEYKNGGFVGFNYMTGKLIFDNKIQETMSLMSYLKSNFKLFKGVINQSDVTYDLYKDSLDLEQKLSTTPIDSVTNGITSDKTNQNNKYITKYDNVQDNFVVYNEKEVLTKNQTDIKSETTKIAGDIELIDFYFGTVKSDNLLNKNNKINIFIFIVAGIAISLVLWLINIRFIQPKKKQA